VSLTPRKDLIALGEIAPDFTAEASDATHVTLSDFRAKRRVILVFYPGDDTPLCTAQLCRMRDDWSALQAADAVVFGVNPAGAERHARFAGKHQFPFPLLADSGGKIAAAYGCRGLFGMIRRTVYALDRRGRVVFAQRGNPAPEEILGVLQATDDTNEPVDSPGRP
jgi:peroxiredoxin Q/BCP